MTPSDSAYLFPDSAPIDSRAALVDARMHWAAVPAKCAVYLLTGASEAEPLLLATVGNLRAALQRRLADDPPDARTKRVAYGQICTRVHWRAVHSPFAANWWYWQSARLLFPDRYRELIAWRPAWWIALERQARFPRLRRTQDLADAAMDYAGPIRDRAAAGTLVSTVEDLFDLCRYHHILVQSPAGKACAYKEMGKCPAPCDGSVPLSWYHEQIRGAFDFIRDAGDSRRQWQAREQAAMRTAAAKLAFEQAARLKQRIERANLLRGDAYECLGRLEDFAFLALQPGRGRTAVEPWFIHGGHVECLPQFKRKDILAESESLFAGSQARGSAPVRPPIDAAGMEQIGLVAHHLFRGQRDVGVYLRLRDVLAGGSDVIARHAAELLDRKSPAPTLPEHASDQAESAEPAEEIPSPAPAPSVPPAPPAVVPPEADC